MSADKTPLLRVEIVRVVDEDGDSALRLQVWETTEVHTDGYSSKCVVDEEISLP